MEPQRTSPRRSPAEQARRAFAVFCILIALVGFGLCVAFGEGLLKPELTIGSTTYQDLRETVALASSGLFWGGANAFIQPGRRFWLHVASWAALWGPYSLFFTLTQSPAARFWLFPLPFTVGLSLVMGCLTWLWDEKRPKKS